MDHRRMQKRGRCLQLFFLDPFCDPSVVLGVLCGEFLFGSLLRCLRMLHCSAKSR